ncbi:MAG: putative ABC transporter permease, partial [Clostridia bacterium]|nr:putative ABC transporter permease [Clostridia bacterium]
MLKETVLRYALYFFFYSAVGWLVESCYCSVRPRKWVNRGFLTGPLCPIYGTGALVFLVFVLPIK